MRIKKIFYLLTTTILGFLLSFLAHALIEIWYLNVADPVKVIWRSFPKNGSCALPIIFQISLPLIGLIGGFFLGLYWWRMVYVEKRRWFSKKKTSKFFYH